MSKWEYLSYALNDKAFGYGNGERFEKTQVRDMCCGDTSNNSVFKMPTHYGTHIDYPFHFSKNGKKSSDYSAGHFIFNFVSITEVNEEIINDYLIRNEHLNIKVLPKETEILIIKTSFCYKRNRREYWEKGLGFHKETARYIKQHLPNVRAIAFDLISLNSYQQREMGREAHKKFLSEEDILIIEEVDLRKIDVSTTIRKMIVSPLLIEKSDGAPVTIIAEIDV